MKFKALLKQALLPALAFVLALFIGGLVIGFTDSKVTSHISNPLEFLKAFGSSVGNAYLALFQGAIYDPNLATGKYFLAGFYPLTETLVASAPLILCGLSVALAFKAGLFNIGAQGQFIFGAIGASYVGFKYDLPIVVHVIAAILVAIIFSSLWGGIVGVLKAKTGAHEVIVTIMLNYIAARFLMWILRTPTFLRPGRIDPLAPPVDVTARLPKLFGDSYRVNLGIIISFIVAGLVYLLLNRTTLGFKFRAVGANAAAARTAGISVSKTVIATMMIAGALAGLGGAVQILGNQFELTGDVAGSFGFDAITVALLGRGGPLGVILASLLFAGLRVGGQTMQANVIAAPGLVSRIFRTVNLASGKEIVSKGWNG
jgi:simple sugar transport system permease protein